MSLISSIQLANTALQATQVGLQVVGQNIANANTPGYIRESVELTPVPTQRVGGLLSGTGVRVLGIVQQVDKFLEERLRNATSDSFVAEVAQQTYARLEELVGELGDTDLSTSLDKFFSSISNILNQPESDANRKLAVLQGQSLTQHFNQLATRAGQLRSDVNDRVEESAADINRLLEDIARLNIQITSAEGGGISASDAVGLRDQRARALAELSELIDVKTHEQENGSVSVFAGGDYLVLEGNSRAVKVTESTDRGLTINELKLVQTDAPLNFTSGAVAGFVISRDDILGGFLDQLNNLAGTLAFEFNKIYSSGQGLKGYRSATSEVSVDDVDAALDATGLDFTPVNGQFTVQIFNRQTSLTQSTVIRVDLNGLDDDTSLTALAAALDAVDGISASITADRRLTLQSDSVEQEIAFAGDTSGILAALGINTFFTGSDARSLGVNEAVADDPATFASSRSGIGATDTEIAVLLAGFPDQPISSQGGATLSQLYDRLTSDVAQGSAVAQSTADGTKVFEQSLRGQSLAISGVSVDEETVNLIQYQRAFQAAAKYIATLNELLEVLVNL